MRAFTVHIARNVVCQLGARVFCAKSAEPIVSWFSALFWLIDMGLIVTFMAVLMMHLFLH